MIQNKRTLQITISITLSVIVLALGTVSGIQAINVFRTTLEKKLAEDSEIIGENLRILIKQVTTEYTTRVRHWFGSRKYSRYSSARTGSDSRVCSTTPVEFSPIPKGNS